jgi:cytochrome c biogenesis protein CcmG/thiol:disulfide interchange protein DsbE
MIRLKYRFGFLFKALLAGMVAFAGLLDGAPAFAAQDWKQFSTPGGQAPEPLQLRDMSGAAVDLAAFRGEVVLVNFWATWCEPCRDEIPALNRLNQKFSAKRFRVVGINVGEGVSRIQQFTGLIPIGFTLLRDEDSAATRTWRVRTLPASFLIDRSGMLRYQLSGDAKWDDAATQAPILDLLK